MGFLLDSGVSVALVCRIRDWAIGYARCPLTVAAAT